MFKYVGKNELAPDIYRYKNAISEIYDFMQGEKIRSDNSALMSKINDIVSSHIVVTSTTDFKESRIFDISSIDFDRLRIEFERIENKNLLIRDLQSFIDQRLDKMLKSNPLRIDYYDKYQKIIEEYNEENKKDKIAIIFENLIKLVSELDEEQKRYIKEGLDSDEELAIFDMLIKDSLSKDEIKKIKSLAHTILEKVKARIKELDNWRNKEETRSIISVLIRDLLWENMPESYDDISLADYRNRIYEYMYSNYPAA